MSLFKKAVIVAAGRSTRLYPLTEKTPKGLLDVGGESMLGRSMGLLRKFGVTDICVVVGFERRQMHAALKQDGVTLIFNPFFAQTNNLGSLWFTQKWVGGDPFVYLHSDLVYDGAMLEEIMSFDPGHGASLLVDRNSVDEEAMKVRLSGDGLLVESNKEIPLDEADGEWTGIAGFSGQVVDTMFDTLEEVLEEGLLEAYDTEAFTRMAGRGIPFRVVNTDGLPWKEVDFLSDLEDARSMFKTDTRSSQ